MNSKVILLSLSVIATGLFALPQAMSLFSGQHSFVAPTEVQCAKCHQDIYDQIQQNSFHVFAGAGNMSGPVYDTAITSSVSGGSAPCVGCHRIGDYTNVSSGVYQYAQVNLTESGQGVDNTHTMVATMECITCHTEAGDLLNNGNTTLTGGQVDAHKAYYDNALAQSKGNISNGFTGLGYIPLKGANAACLGCHSHTVVTINWTRDTGYNMLVTETTNSKNVSQYSIAFSMNSTATNTTTTSGQ